MSDKTTTEQLAEIEGQPESTAATEYTPPDGWRVLAVGETISPGDQWVRPDDGRVFASIRSSGIVLKGTRYLRRIEQEPQPQPQPQPQPEPQPQPQPVQVREGRWRTRGGEIKNIRPCEPLKGAYYAWPWTDGFKTFQDNGRHLGSNDSVHDLVEYLGPIEEQPQPETQPQPEPQAATIEELRSEVSYVQRLLGESRQRVTQLEELVVSLRTINEAQEKSVRLAGQANTDLQHRLDVVSAEWAEQSETVRKLRIELDAAQQVPQAVSDRFEEGWDAGTSQAVETIAEWTEPFRTCGSERLAWMVMQNLPHIMRTLTGLTPED